MATFIVIDEQAFETNTEAEVQAAREALREAGIVYADEWAGVPDDTNDAYKNGNKLFAAKGA
jgi:hypothetical protein